MIKNLNQRFALVSGLLTLLLTPAAQAQIASGLVREGDTVGPGTVEFVNNTAVNHVGGYAVTLSVDDGVSTISTIFGNASGGAGAVLRTEGTFGDLTQTSFESFFGFADSGVSAYSASSTSMSSGTTGLDGVWLGDAIVQNEEDPVADAPGEFSSFNSRPGVTADGNPYWVGGLTDMPGNSTVSRALFYDSNIVLRDGDNVGVPEPVSPGSGIGFDFRFSKLGTNYISEVDVQSASSSDDALVVINGTVINTGGSNMREGTLMPVSVGGDGAENWDNFDFLGISEAGDYFVTGDTDGDTLKDEFVFMNDAVVLREGDQVGGLTISGSISGGYMNEDGDWAVVWDVDQGGSNVEALIVNGELLLLENDLVDWNGDGVIDASDEGFAITDFTGISSLTLSDRDASGGFSAYFTADAVNVTGLELEAAFRVVVPEPGSAALLMMAMAGLLVVRRKP